jgi:hypothetical protein
MISSLFLKSNIIISSPIHVRQSAKHTFFKSLIAPKELLLISVENEIFSVTLNSLCSFLF